MGRYGVQMTEDEVLGLIADLETASAKHGCRFASFDALTKALIQALQQVPR